MTENLTETGYDGTKSPSTRDPQGAQMSYVKALALAEQAETTLQSARTATEVVSDHLRELPS